MEHSLRQSEMHKIFERNRNARKICLNYYGNICFNCGFEDFHNPPEMEIHYIGNYLKVDNKYQLDPIGDLRSICSNCHKTIHNN